jgi:twitching motility protein PilT
VIVVGDLRDHETASLAISAAETGHLVLASMPSMNAMKTLDKLLDMFPSGEQASVRTMVSESLRGILCQKLLPGLGGTQVLAVELLFNSIGIGNMIRENKLSGLQNAMQTGKNVGMKTFDMSASELLKAKLISAATARIAK